MSGRAAFRTSSQLMRAYPEKFQEFSYHEGSAPLGNAPAQPQ